MKFENLLLIYHLPWGNKCTEIVKRWFRNNFLASRQLIIDFEFEKRFPTLKEIHFHYPNIKTCTVIINPYARAILKYEWSKENNINKEIKTDNFENFLYSYYKLKYKNDSLFFKNQKDIIEYNDNKKIVKTTFILKRENLIQDFKKIQNFCSSNVPLIIRDIEPEIEYKNFYNSTTIDLATKLFQDDIESFNYKF